MELRSKTRKELEELKKETTYLMRNETLYHDIFTILKSDLDFLAHTDLKLTDEYLEPQYSGEENAFLLNIEEVYVFCKKLAYSWLSVVPRERIEALTKEFIFLTMLHETAHAEQRACIYEDYSPYPEVNRLYRKYEEGQHPLNFLYRFNYHFRGNRFAFERNANLNAYRELVHIGNDEFLDLYKQAFLVVYIEDYNYGKSVMAPALKTCHMMGRKYDFLNEGIPTPVLVEHGFVLPPKEYNEFIVEVDEIKSIDQAYQLCLNKLGRG